jgi:cytochrome c-type biogenesis protein
VDVASLVSSGPLLLALPVAAAAGAVTFLSPCCLPLVPGYLAYITGMSGAEVIKQETQHETAVPGAAAVAGGAGAVSVAVPAVVVPAAVPRGRMVAGTALFVLGFSLVFCLLGMTVGGISQVLHSHAAGITQVLGGVTVLLGLLFFGAFDRFTLAGRIIKPSAMPRAGLAGAPLLGVLFGIGWTPCIGPTLAAVQTLSFTAAPPPAARSSPWSTGLASASRSSLSPACSSAR